MCDTAAFHMSGTYSVHLAIGRRARFRGWSASHCNTPTAPVSEGERCRRGTLGEPEVPPGWWARVGGLAENHPACEMLKGPFKTKLNRVSNRQTHFQRSKGKCGLWCFAEAQCHVAPANRSRLIVCSRWHMVMDVFPPTIYHLPQRITSCLVTLSSSSPTRRGSHPCPHGRGPLR